MSPELQSLVQLQHLDTLIADAKATIAAHPARIADADARIQEAERVVTEATERLKASQEHRRTVEKDAAVYQGRLAKYKIPRSVIFVEALPKTGPGKIDKKLLVEQFGQP